MTPTSPPPQNDRRFARDVARELDRKRMRRKLTLWTALLGLIAAAAAYLRCGDGFGIGGFTGTGDGPREAEHAPRTPGPARCAIRVTPKGITVDGKPMSRDQAVAACKAIGGADVVITGDARYGDGELLLTALKAADVTNIVVHEPAPGGGSGSATP
jgi:hypothetical protein